MKKVIGATVILSATPFLVIFSLSAGIFLYLVAFVSVAGTIALISKVVEKTLQYDCDIDAIMAKQNVVKVGAYYCPSDRLDSDDWGSSSSSSGSSETMRYSSGSSFDYGY